MSLPILTCFIFMVLSSKSQYRRDRSLWFYDPDHDSITHWHTHTHSQLSAGVFGWVLCVDLIMSTGIQLLGFLMCLGGWLLSLMSLLNDSWRSSTFADQLITSVWYDQNLWQSCAEGSTGVRNCKQFESMLSLSGNTLLTHTYKSLCSYCLQDCLYFTPKSKGKIDFAW